MHLYLHIHIHITNHTHTENMSTIITILLVNVLTSAAPHGHDCVVRLLGMHLLIAQIVAEEHGLDHGEAAPEPTGDRANGRKILRAAQAPLIVLGPG